MAEGPLNPAAVSPETIEQGRQEFLEFMRNEIANPPKVVNLFKIPEGLSPAWQEFFNKVLAYYERQCAANRHALVSLEKRSWIMEDEELSQFEMLMSATNFKEKGNEEFKKGDIARAQLLYSSSISTFPTPDALNNMAACSLKLNQFKMAEDFATKALDMNLFSNPLSNAKAHFRRSSARLHLANFKGAEEDATAAKQLNPSDSSIEELHGRIQSFGNSVKTPEDVKQYLDQQPQPADKVSFDEAFNKIQDLQIAYTRIPPFMLEKMKTGVAPESY